MVTHAALMRSIAASVALIAASALPADSGPRFEAILSGSTEVPGPGDSDGRGTASVTVDPGERKLCYTLGVGNIDRATMAHLHRAAVGVAGPVMVALKAPASGRSAGCITLTNELAARIVKSPADYYVHVHTTEFPGGAIRGQLASKR